MPDPILPHPGTTWLEFGQTCDGYYCKNLAPGLYTVTGELCCGDVPLRSHTPGL